MEKTILDIFLRLQHAAVVESSLRLADLCLQPLEDLFETMWDLHCLQVAIGLRDAEKTF